MIFAVRLEGAGLVLTTTERRWLFFSKRVTTPGGFFVTAWVDAPTPEQATERAVARVREEVAQKLAQGAVAEKPGRALSLTVAEVAPSDDHPDGHRTGYIWFPEDS